MALTREERRVLEEKYKEQRQSMWAGKRPSSIAQGERFEKASEDSDSVDRLLQGSDSNRARTKSLDENQPAAISSQASVDQSEQTRLNAKSIARDNRENTVPATGNIDTQQMIQKIRRQREDIWQGNSATRQPRQNTKGKVGKFWNPTQQDEAKRPIRWRLALAVFGAVAVLVSVGVLIGYWFAS